MNDAGPKVSVVVCTYNQERYIGMSLDSIIAQKTDFAFEIILADDCSTDGTEKICRQYAEKYPGIVHYIRNKTNKGVAHNYFDAIRAAKGKYIADLAGDDVWIDTYKLQRQADLLDSDPEITLTHAAWEMFTDDGKIFSSHEHWMPKKDEVVDGNTLLPIILAHKKEQRFIHLCTAMYRRDTVIELFTDYAEVFEPKWLPCEDFQLEVLLASRGKIACQSQKVLLYRVGNVSVSSTENARKTVSFTSRVVRLTIILARLLGISPDAIADYTRFNLHYALMTAFNAGDSMAMKEASALSRNENIFPALKTRIAMILSSNRSIWKLTLGLRRMMNKK